MSGNRERTSLTVVKFDRSKPCVCYDEELEGDEYTTDVRKVNCEICIEWLRDKGLIHEDSG